MRPPAKIKEWMTIDKMFQWLQAAPDEAAHKRRMAIWLTHTGKLNAGIVAETLNVSVQAVWLWIKQYNKEGPAGLFRAGRGGRRWAFLPFDQEVEILKPFIKMAQNGTPPPAGQVKQVVEENLDRKVSKSYVYRLLARHNWAGIIAQSHDKKPQEHDKNDFITLSQPWKRQT